MADTPTTEPREITAGDSIRWRRSLPEHPPADGWTLKYALVNAGGNISITAVPDGGDFLVEVSPTDSGGWVSGDYTWVAYVEKSGERRTVDRGEIRVHPNLAALTGGYDTRSHARRMLDAVCAVLEKRATATHLSYQHDGRQLQYIPHSELLELKEHYAREVAKEEALERARKGLSRRNRVLVKL